MGEKRRGGSARDALACNKRNELDTRALIIPVKRAREKEKSIYRQVNRDVNRMPRRERITRGHVADWQGRCHRRFQATHLRLYMAIT